MTSHEASDSRAQPDHAVVETLVSQHRKFLAFLERRVGSRAVAEDLLQTAFARGLEHAADLRDDESAVAWFYRVLRNALVDHYRRRDAERRATERYGGEETDRLDPELRDVVCACLHDLVPTLRPEYAEVLRRVDFEERDPALVAGELGLSSANMRVRLHRARQALRAQLERSCGTCATHACLECACGGSRPALTLERRDQGAG